MTSERWSRKFAQDAKWSFFLTVRAYDNVSEARASIGRYLDFYNGRRPHSSLDGATPDKAYFTPLPLRLAA
jgi:putative transposase